MKIIFYFVNLIGILSAIYFIKINGEKTDIIKQDPSNEIITPRTTETEQSDIEYLSEIMLINNDSPFEGDIKTLKSFIKKPNTVQKQIDDCGAITEDSHEIWNYLNCEIEVSKTN